MTETDKQRWNNFEWLAAYSWQKWQSGNPKGRPKTKTLKEFAREFLSNMSDEQRMAYFSQLNPEFVWKMWEGNPHQTSDETVKLLIPKPILPDVRTDDSNEEGTSTPEED